VLGGVPSVDERCEVFDWLCSLVVAVYDYGQVDHGLQDLGQWFIDSEVFEFCEASSEKTEGVSNALVDLEGIEIQSPVEEWPVRFGELLCRS